MKVILDAMGGDNAPAEIVLGAIKAARETGVQICLVGRGGDILSALEKHGIAELPKGIEIADAAEVVDMSDEPATVMRSKRDSSMAVGLRLLGDGYGDVFASAGSTGALLTGSTLSAKRVRGIRRAALGVSLPTTTGGHAFLIDCGANIDCTPEYLLQFAYMGSFYAERYQKKTSPRVGLLNIGSEPSKGSPLQRETHALLVKAREEKRINFIGNIEARDVMTGVVDVIVSDGYSGNILLKSIEGMGLFFKDVLKDVFYKNAATKVAGLMVNSGISRIKKMMDYNSVGGAPLLGISKPVFKIHGSAKASAVAAAIDGAVLYAQSGIIEAIVDNIEYMKVDVEAE